jgi:hypothetical protein
VRIFNVILFCASFATGQSITIDSVVVLSKATVLPFIEARIFQPISGSEVQKETSILFDNIKTDTPFLSDKTQFTLARFNQNKIAAVIHFDPHFDSHVSGMIGTGKTPEGTWESQGELNLHLENVWGTIGTIDVNWHRRDLSSQYTDIQIVEPYLPIIPIGIKFGWKEHLQEGFTLLRSKTVSTIFHANNGWKWDTGIKKTEINPTENGLLNGYKSSSSDMMVFGLSKNSVNHRWLPTVGFRMKTLFDYGIEKKENKRSAISGFKFETEYFHPFKSSWIWMAGLKGQGIFSESGEILSSQKIQFGGMASLRGFREDFFKADWVVIPTIEIRYALFNRMQFSAFIESGLHSEVYQYPVSYGFGLIQESDAAIIKLFYGVGTGNSPSEDGTIHIQFIGLL